MFRGAWCRSLRLVATPTFGVVAVVIAFGFFAAEAQAVLFWANEGNTGIGRANLDGSDVMQQFVTSGFGPFGVAADGKYIYWTNYQNNAISRDTIDGNPTNIDSTFITGADQPYGLAVSGNYIYWANFGNGTIGRDTIDGNPANVIQGFISGGNHPDKVAVDASHIYWSNEGGGIGRANLDGSGVHQDFIPAGVPHGVAVDSSYIYWSNYGSGTIGRDTIDGNPKNVDQNFITGANLPYGVAVSSSYIYWANHDGQSIGRDTIDGNPENVDQNFIAANGPDGVAVAPVPVSTAPPSIGGLPRLGQLLTEARGSWLYSPTQFAYKWLRCNGVGASCSAIGGATGQKYTVGQADLGATLRVQEIATNPFGGDSLPATSSATTVVEGASSASISLATVSSLGRTASITIACTGRSGATCSGRAELTAHTAKRKHTVLSIGAANPLLETNVDPILMVGGAHFSIASGHSKRLRIGLNRTGRRLLDKSYRLVTTLTVTAGNTVSRSVGFRYKELEPNIYVQTSTSSATTKLLAVEISELPDAARVVVACHGSGCPFGRRSLKLHKHRIRLSQPIVGAHLAAGATLRFAITAPNWVGFVKLYRIRPGAVPSTACRAQPPGTRTLTPIPCP
jgi:virginiamycin B lyase